MQTPDFKKKRIKIRGKKKVSTRDEVGKKKRSWQISEKGKHKGIKEQNATQKKKERLKKEITTSSSKKYN